MYAGQRVEVTDKTECPVDGTAQCLSKLGSNASVSLHFVSQSGRQAGRLTPTQTLIDIHAYMNT